MTVQQSARITRLVKEVARLRRVLTRHGIERPKRRRTKRVAKPDPRQLAMFKGEP
jgi:hypothetical protein